MKVSNILHEELLLKLRKMAKAAESRFSKLIVFRGSTWIEDAWLYRDRDHLRFFTAKGVSEELALLNKVFIVNYLWERRSSNNQITYGRLYELAWSVRYLSEQGVSTLLDLKQSSYTKTFRFIQSNYKHPGGPCRALNLFVGFLFESGLSPQTYDLIGTAGINPKDKYGRVSIEKKMPLPDLVKAIISLKWAIQDQWNRSLRSQIDFLGVLTQIFQFGLGLRIGEVLRLPKDCLFFMNGEMYCRVWTEKGTEPSARYVPTIWRSAFSDAVEKINSICEPHRRRAASLEDGSFVQALDDRFQARKLAISSDIQTVLERLDCRVTTEVLATQCRVSALKSVPTEELIELKDLIEYLPFASRSRDSSSLVKFYKANGFKVISIPSGKVKFSHYVLGRDLETRVEQLVQLRRETIFYDEFFEVLHGRRPSLSNSKDRFALKGKLKSKVMRSVEAFALTGEYRPNGRRVVYLDYVDAVASVREIVGGGYDHANFIPILDAEHLYPEFFNQKTMTSIASKYAAGFYSFLRTTEARMAFYRPSTQPSDLNYRVVSGFLIEHDSIKEAVINSFVSINTRISSELIEGAKEDFLADGIEIGSATFGVNQKVSDHLFVVPSAQGGVYNEYLPSILSYDTVLHVIKPTKLERSAFQRYGVTSDDLLIKSFQSHQGRHWQTNSLFRAGLAASIVNKWMGRTDSQGDHYDHQTPRERAARVSELMLSEQSRFIGAVASKIKSWAEQDIPEADLRDYLDKRLQAVHYGPLGHCLRDINLKPCEFHLKCLTGNAGKGCREFVVDLHDPVQLQQIEAERSRSESELARLFEALSRPDVPTESVEMHIEHQITIFRNACHILDRSEVVLTQGQVAESRNYQPFVQEGSVPSDCVFQCGAV